MAAAVVEEAAWKEDEEVEASPSAAPLAEDASPHISARWRPAANTVLFLPQRLAHSLTDACRRGAARASPRFRTSQRVNSLLFNSFS